MSNNARIGIRAPSTSVEFIGPREARVLLDSAAPNRKINDDLVLKYAFAMLHEDWQNIGVPLILDERGRLSDGQHRLSAVIESETVQQFNVVEGVPHGETLMAIDTGRKRSIGDILQIITRDPEDARSFSHVKHLPSIARRLFAYQQSGDMNADLAVVRRLSPGHLVAFISDNQKDLEEGARVGKRIHGTCSMSSTGVGAAHIVCVDADPDLAVEFAEEMHSPSQAANPAWVLREQAIKDARKRQGTWVGSPRLTAAMWIKGFNLYRHGVVPKQIQFKNVGPHLEAFPTA